MALPSSFPTLLRQLDPEHVQQDYLTFCIDALRSERWLASASRSGLINRGIAYQDTKDYERAIADLRHDGSAILDRQKRGAATVR